MSHQIEDALVSIVITKLHFFQVEREFVFGDAVELYQSLLCIAPEPLDTVNIDLAVGKELLMVNVDMTITTEHKRVIAFKPVCIDNTAASYGFDREVPERVRALTSWTTSTLATPLRSNMTNTNSL